MFACSSGHTEIEKLLFNKGADYNICNINGCSPMMSACNNGNTEIVKILLDKGADYSKCENNNWAPIT